MTQTIVRPKLPMRLVLRSEKIDKDEVKALFNNLEFIRDTLTKINDDDVNKFIRLVDLEKCDALPIYVFFDSLDFYLYLTKYSETTNFFHDRILKFYIFWKQKLNTFVKENILHLDKVVNYFDEELSKLSIEEINKITIPESILSSSMEIEKGQLTGSGRRLFVGDGPLKKLNNDFRNNLFNPLIAG